MKKNVFTAVLVFALSGCTGSDIDTVKEGRLHAYPEYTIGQTFDSRSICKETSWKMVKDDRGRDLVEYRCMINGLPQAYADAAQKIIASLERSESSLGDYDTEIVSSQQRIVELEAELAKRTANPESASSNDRLAKYDQDISSLADFITTLKAHSIEDFIEVPYERPGSACCDDKVRDSIQALDKLAVDFADARQRGDSDGQQYLAGLIRSRVEEGNARKDHLIETLTDMHGRLIRDRADYAETSKSSSARVLVDIERRITEEQKRIETQISRKAHEIESINKSLNQAQKILESSGTASGFEYLQWSVDEAGAFTIVNGGVEISGPMGKSYSMEYTDHLIEQSVAQIYANGSQLIQVAIDRALP